MDIEIKRRYKAELDEAKLAYIEADGTFAAKNYTEFCRTALSKYVKELGEKYPKVPLGDLINFLQEP